MAFFRPGKFCFEAIAASLFLTLICSPGQVRASNNKVLKKQTLPTQAINSKKIDKEKKKSTWEIELRADVVAPTDNVNTQTGDVSTVNQFGISYFLRDNVTLSVKPSLAVDYNLEFGRAKNRMGNTIAELKIKDWWRFASIKNGVEFRFYAPTGEKFREQGTAGMFSIENESKMTVSSRLDLLLKLNPQYFMQTQRAVTKYDEFDRILSNPKPLTSFRIKSELWGLYKIVGDLSFGQIIGLDHSFKYGDPGLELGSSTVTSFESKTGLSLKLPQFHFILAIAQSHDLGGEESYSLLNAKETSYYFRGSVKF